MNKFLIYGLVDPRNGQLKYIGKSCSGLKRPNNYRLPSQLRHEGTSKKVAWLKRLTTLGSQYEIVVLEDVLSKADLAEAEQFYIAYYKFVGCDLLNATAGGDGGRLGMKLSEETKRKIGLAASRRKVSAQTRFKMSLAHRDKSHSWNRARKVIDHNGVVYNSIKDAAQQLNLRRSLISQVLACHQHQTGGYAFTYAA